MPSERRELHRSIEGCTVCRIKSTKEPFADSSKWEKYFSRCFLLTSNRGKEICRSCIRLISKWRRQPINLKEDYSKVVDSCQVLSLRRRSSSTKKQRLSLVEMEIGTKEENKVALMEEDDALSDVADERDEDVDSTGHPDAYFDSPSPDSVFGNDDDALIVGEPAKLVLKHRKSRDMVDTASQTSFLFPALTSPEANKMKLPYIDLSTWRQEQICCGTIFRGPRGEVLVDPKWLNPSCGICSRSTLPPTPVELAVPQEISRFDPKLSSLVSV